MAAYLHCCPELNPTNCFVFRSDYLETEEMYEKLFKSFNYLQKSDFIL